MPGEHTTDQQSAAQKALAEQAAIMQFLTGQSIGRPPGLPPTSSGSGISDSADLSLSLAAAAALLPPVYDSLTGMFYSPSALAQMAAGLANSQMQSAGVVSTAPSAGPPQELLGKGSTTASALGSGSTTTTTSTAGKRSRRKGGGASNTSANYISNLMPKFQNEKSPVLNSSTTTAGSRVKKFTILEPKLDLFYSYLFR